MASPNSGEKMPSDWLAFRLICLIYTLGISYALVSGLVHRAHPTAEEITLCRVDNVSSYYGPGSWAAWLLTTQAS